MTFISIMYVGNGFFRCFIEMIELVEMVGWVQLVGLVEMAEMFIWLISGQVGSIHLSNLAGLVGLNWVAFSHQHHQVLTESHALFFFPSPNVIM